MVGWMQWGGRPEARDMVATNRHSPYLSYSRWALSCYSTYGLLCTHPHPYVYYHAHATKHSPSCACAQAPAWWKTSQAYAAAPAHASSPWSTGAMSTSATVVSSGHCPQCLASKRARLTRSGLHCPPATSRRRAGPGPRPRKRDEEQARGADRGVVCSIAPQTVAP